MLCDCMTEEQQVCTATCMTHTMTAMGITTQVHGQHPPLVYTQPLDLTSHWHLKYTVTLQSPTGQAHNHISSIIVGAVMNVQPFLQSWVACILSITSWTQLASLSGYSKPTVLHALHSAVPRIVSRTPWDVDGTLHMYCPAAVTRSFIACAAGASHKLCGPRKHMRLGTYHMWDPVMPCADWCHDFPVLNFFSPRQDPREPIHAGLCPPGGGGSRFPIVCEPIVCDCPIKVGPIGEA